MDLVRVLRLILLQFSLILLLVLRGWFLILFKVLLWLLLVLLNWLLIRLFYRELLLVLLGVGFLLVHRLLLVLLLFHLVGRRIRAVDCLCLLVGGLLVLNTFPSLDPSPQIVTQRERKKRKEEGGEGWKQEHLNGSRQVTK